MSLDPIICLVCVWDLLNGMKGVLLRPRTHSLGHCLHWILALQIIFELISPLNSCIIFFLIHLTFHTVREENFSLSLFLLWTLFQMKWWNTWTQLIQFIAMMRRKAGAEIVKFVWARISHDNQRCWRLSLIFRNSAPRRKQSKMYQALALYILS